MQADSVVNAVIKMHPQTAGISSVGYFFVLAPFWRGRRHETEVSFHGNGRELGAGEAGSGAAFSEIHPHIQVVERPCLHRHRGAFPELEVVAEPDVG